MRPWELVEVFRLADTLVKDLFEDINKQGDCKELVARYIDFLAVVYGAVERNLVPLGPLTILRNTLFLPASFTWLPWFKAFPSELFKSIPDLAGEMYLTK